MLPICDRCKQEYHIDEPHSCRQAIWERRLQLENSYRRELRELAESEMRLEKSNALPT